MENDYLTNEKLKYKFLNNFDLANFGIKYARNKIVNDEQVTLKEVLHMLIELPNIVEKKA
ncbi:MAG: hypothetical protein K1060chlam5_01230 [Candidatus Anoxychlamydiales bacterium]|nr:hypothetical protein [Candidatus Anoxychlamydiales bacterium]